MSSKESVEEAARLAALIERAVSYVANTPELNPHDKYGTRQFSYVSCSVIKRRGKDAEVGFRNGPSLGGPHALSLAQARAYLAALRAGCVLAPGQEGNTAEGYRLDDESKQRWRALHAARTEAKKQATRELEALEGVMAQYGVKL